MKKVVKAKNLIAFRIWLEKLGYSVKTLADNRGFTLSFKKAKHAYSTLINCRNCDLNRGVTVIQVTHHY